MEEGLLAAEAAVAYFGLISEHGFRIPRNIRQNKYFSQLNLLAYFKTMF
jgi:hypothetical protein